MKVVDAHVEEITFHLPEGYPTIEAWLEKVGRVCYQSADKITEESAPKFIRMLRKRGHWAMLEHAIVSVRIIGDRGLMGELTRHRLCSYAVESSRYCCYSKDKFNNEITVIRQPGIPEDNYAWNFAMQAAEDMYLSLIKQGVKPDAARSVLPMALKTEMVCTANLREWAAIFELRCDTPAHPIIRGVALDILKEFNKRLPSLYEEQAERFLTNGND
jgi:thymidylate synthase (FAD)